MTYDTFLKYVCEIYGFFLNFTNVINIFFKHRLSFDVYDIFFVFLVKERARICIKIITEAYEIYHVCSQIGTI